MGKSPEQSESPPSADATAASMHKHKAVSVINSPDVVVGVSSLVAGGLTAKRLIEERAYKNVSSHGLWDDIKPLRVSAGTKIVKQALAREITPQEAHTMLKEDIFQDGIMKRERLKKLGSDTFLKQYELLRPHQKWEVAIAGLTSFGIALGSLLLFSHEMFSKKEREELANKGNDTAPPAEPGMQR